MLARLRANSPRRKPQLWEAPLFATRRRMAQWMGLRKDKEWLDVPIVSKLRNHGIRMELIPRNYYIDGFIYTFGVYEVSGTRFFESILQADSTVLDVGANSGYYSLLSSALVGPAGRVHAFEPSAEVRLRLRRNISLNSANNVIVHEDAVTDHGGEVDFFLSNTPRNEGLSSTVPGDGRQSRATRVPCTTLDAFAQSLPVQPTLIKIDIEGGEGLALAGATAILGQSTGPALMFETYEIEPISQLLSGCGYEVRALHYSLRSGLEFFGLDQRYANVFESYEGLNYVALKRGSTPSFEDLSRMSLEKMSFSARVARHFA